MRHQGSVVGREVEVEPAVSGTLAQRAKKHVIALDREARSIHAQLKRSGYRDRLTL